VYTMQKQISIFTFLLIINHLLISSPPDNAHASTLPRATGKIECLIRGKVIDRPESHTLYLEQYDEDIRINR
ncbi:MAG: hypothetical protein LUD15_03275, partial [Bacteroides sp.]|nr:hypothetical protein [Bacteroides sp.]